MEYEYLEEHIKDSYNDKEYSICLDFCKELIQIDSQSKTANDYMAICYSKLGYNGKAINIYNEIIRNGKHDFSSFVFRGDCYYKMRLYKQALNDFIESLKIDAYAGASWQRVAECYFMLGDYEEAHINIDRAIQMSDYHRDPWSIKAIFYKLNGKNDESFRMFSEIREKYPNDKFLVSQQFEILYNSLIKK